jgi:hypothetical protein
MEDFPMAGANQGEITFTHLRDFLVGLGFEQPASLQQSHAFLHRKSGVVLMVSAARDTGPVRPADLLSVLMRLECEGLASEADLQQFRSGRLPKAS